MRTLFFLCFCFCSIFGQSGRVDYFLITKPAVDTTGKKNYTVFNQNKSLYVSKSAKTEHKIIQEPKKEEQQINTTIKYKDSIGKRVLNHYQSDTLLLRETSLGKAYKVIDKKKIVWKVFTETKTFGNLVAKRAECTFRGRDYIAWFCPDIPVPAGPWKLQGLPGLILEAYTTDRKYCFFFKSIQHPVKNEIKFDLAIETAPISLKQFVEEKEAATKNMVNDLYAKLPRGTQVQTISKDKRMGFEIKFEWEE